MKFIEIYKGSNVISLTTFFIISFLLSFPFINDFYLYGDYSNHIFMSSYTISTFLDTGIFPGLISTDKYLGDPALLFYGIYIFPLLGSLGALIGFDHAIGLLVFIINFLSLCALFLLLRRQIPYLISIGSAIIFVITPYQMTNLFQRTALPEYLAAQTTLLCFLIIFLIVDFHLREKMIGSLRFKTLGILSFIVLTCTVVSHPPSSMILIISLFLLISVLFLFLVFHRYLFNNVIKLFIKYKFYIIGIIVIMSVFSAVWLLPTVLFKQYLSVTQTKLELFAFDKLRLSLLPQDPRIWFMPINEISTPYLTPTLPYGQILVTLMLCYAINNNGVFKERLNWMAFIYLLLITIAVLISLDYYPDIPVFGIFGNVQFGYRYISLIPVFSLALLFIYTLNHGINEVPEPLLNILRFAIFIGIVAIGMKFNHTLLVEKAGVSPYSTTTEDKMSIKKNPYSLPQSYWFYHSYAFSRTYEVTPDIKVIKNFTREDIDGGEFPVQFENQDSCSVFCSNIVIAPFIKLTMNGKNAEITGRSSKNLAVYNIPNDDLTSFQIDTEELFNGFLKLRTSFQIYLYFAFYRIHCA